MLSLWSEGDAALLKESSGALYTCRLDTTDVRVVEVSALRAVVAMVPHPTHLAAQSGSRAQLEGKSFVFERFGLDSIGLGELWESATE
jgi:hypothetical protein